VLIEAMKAQQARIERLETELLEIKATGRMGRAKAIKENTRGVQ
jgi:hypothetical protein